PGSEPIARIDGRAVRLWKTLLCACCRIQPIRAPHCDGGCTARLRTYRSEGQHVFWTDSVSVREDGRFRCNHVRGHERITDVYLLGWQGPVRVGLPRSIRRFHFEPSKERTAGTLKLSGSRASPASLVDWMFPLTCRQRRPRSGSRNLN